MDAFYASVEQRDNPSLRGRPVAVGGSPAGRGVVAAASYEARRFGIRSVTPLVEPLSLDEAYLDVTDNSWGERLGQVVAQRLKAEIRKATSLTASAGVAPNKFLAKIASAWQKPDGLTVIAPERMEQFLRKLPVDALWGVGPITAARLRERGIERLIDVRQAAPSVLREAVGSSADWLRRLADGQDDRPVVPHHEPKSSGSENTFSADLTDPGRFYIFERWESQAALEQHFAAPHMARFQQALGPLGVKELAVQRYDVSKVGPLRP
jgi:DNA polymerase-4